MQPRFESPIMGVFERLLFALKFGLFLLGSDGTAGGLDCIVGRIYIGPDKKGNIRLSICTLRCKSAFPSVQRNILYHIWLVQLRNWIQLENVSFDLSTGGLRALPIIVTGLALKDITRGKC